MAIEQFWQNALDLFGTLDQHPVLHAGLGLSILLAIALVLGRVARFLILHAVKLLARQPALHWVNDLRVVPRMLGPASLRSRSTSA